MRRRLLPPLLLLVALAAPVSADTPPADGEWAKVGESEGITVLRKEIPGDPVFAYRGMGILDAPLGKLISVSLDVRRQPEWVNRLEEARVLRQISPLHRVLYLKIDTPWPVKDRDFVVESKFVVDEGSKTLSLATKSIEDPSMPPQDCCVRGAMHYSNVQLTDVDGSGTRTAVSAEAHVDPKGSIPKWIVNRIQQTFPHKSIGGLLRQVRKADIEDYFRRGAR